MRHVAIVIVLLILNQPADAAVTQDSPAGQAAIGIPCVIGGSASQGLLSFWEKQQ